MLEHLQAWPEKAIALRPFHKPQHGNFVSRLNFKKTFAR